MKLETILKVIEIIRRSGEQSKYICMDNEYFLRHTVQNFTYLSQLIFKHVIVMYSIA